MYGLEKLKLEHSEGSKEKPKFEIQVLALLLFLTNCMTSLGITLLTCKIKMLD